jgi:hypothetical protein
MMESMNLVRRLSPENQESALQGSVPVEPMMLQYLMIHPQDPAPGRRLTKEYGFLTRNLLLHDPGIVRKWFHPEIQILPQPLVQMEPMVVHYLMIHPQGPAPGRRLTKEYGFLPKNLLLRDPGIDRKWFHPEIQILPQPLVQMEPMVLQYLMIRPQDSAPGRRLTKEYGFLPKNLLMRDPGIVRKWIHREIQIPPPPLVQMEP